MPVNITFLGHAGFLVAGSSHAVAIDPFLTGNPSAGRGPDAVECQAIVLTHGHADHLGDTVAIARANGATVYGAFELCEYLGEQGIESTEAMNHGGHVDAPFGFVAMTQAIHSSSFEGIYHCGDTDLFSDMKLIGEIYEPDIAMIPIGDRFTMGPHLATHAAELIQPKIAIPVHFNTWPPIEQDPADFAPSGVEVKVMAPEDVLTYG